MPFFIPVLIGAAGVAIAAAASFAAKEMFDGSSSSLLFLRRSTP